ncbi:hypothetical protein CDAR_390301 [Caerostris darwini]|uniref:Transmembrane protein n=1 Tax=Caerostris darwini TaxID=1538125 RepID=A0AAV4NZ19_9ARAC|nr:hypothetical protein CDAR_390301 [Caerostris darwini]
MKRVEEMREERFFLSRRCQSEDGDNKGGVSFFKVAFRRVPCKAAGSFFLNEGGGFFYFIPIMHDDAFLVLRRNNVVSCVKGCRSRVFFFQLLFFKTEFSCIKRCLGSVIRFLFFRFFSKKGVIEEVKK